MSSRYAKQLNQRAQDFCIYLQQHKISAQIAPDSLRDYSINLEVSLASLNGQVVIYYSPKRGRFQLGTHLLKHAALAKKLADLWEDAYGIGDDGTRPTGDYQAYVDGSYNGENAGYGAVILHNRDEIARLSGKAPGDPQIRQIAGELVAVMKLMDWCQSNGVTEIDVLYDYVGIEKWATGKWQAKSDLARQYAETMRTCPVKITWYNVDSHTGVRWNNVADQLARDGAGEPVATENTSAEIQQDDELHALTETFAAYVTAQGITAEFDRVHNNQYGRIIILAAGKKAGYFDLYNTKNRPLVPYLHGFKNSKIQVQIEAIWDKFKQQHVEKS